jgi:hypothetical protein
VRVVVGPVEVAGGKQEKEGNVSIDQLYRLKRLRPAQVMTLRDKPLSCKGFDARFVDTSATDSVESAAIDLSTCALPAPTGFQVVYISVVVGS